MAIWACGVTFRDAKGQRGKTRYFVQNNGAGTAVDANTKATAIEADIAALSNAVVVGVSGPIGQSVASPNAYGANAVFEDSADKAIMTFMDASGAFHRFQIPAPKAAIFKPDGETVDSANALVTTFTTDVLALGAATATVVTRDGRALTAFIGGTRLRRKQPRRMDIFTKSSDLATPAL